MASNLFLVAMDSNLIAMGSNLMASNRIPTASNLRVMTFNLRAASFCFRRLRRSDRFPVRRDVFFSIGKILMPCEGAFTGLRQTSHQPSRYMLRLSVTKCSSIDLGG